MARKSITGVSALLKGLKKGLVPAYVLVGEEELLRTEAEKAIAEAVFGPEGGDEQAATIFHGPTRKNDIASLPLAGVLDELQTRSMFAPRKFVVVREADLWIGEHSDALTRYLDRAPRFATLVLSVRKLDGRIRFTKRVRQVGVVVDCSTPYESGFGESVPSAGSELGRWIERRAKAKGLSIGGRELVALMELVGTSMRELDEALDKIAIYLASDSAGSGGQSAVVSTETLEAVVANARRENAFKLVDAALGANRARAFSLAARVFENGLAMQDGKVERSPQTVALLVIAQLGNEIERRLKAKSAMMRGDAEGEIARRINLRPFLVRSFFGALRGARLESLQRQLKLVFDADLALKTGAREPRLLVETLLLRLNPSDRHGAGEPGGLSSGTGARAARR